MVIERQEDSTTFGGEYVDVSLVVGELTGIRVKTLTEPLPPRGAGTISSVYLSLQPVNI